MADYKVTDSELTSIANAIRTKGGTSAQLEFPSGFVSAVQNISTSGGGSSERTSGFGPFTGIMPSSTSDTGIKIYSTPCDPLNLVTAGLCSSNSIGHTVICAVSIKKAMQSEGVSVSGFTELCKYGDVIVFVGTLSQSTTLTVGYSDSVTLGFGVITLEIADGYEVSAYTNLCKEQSSAGQTFDDEYIKTANAYRIAVNLPQGFGVMFLSSTFDYNNSIYRPTIWESDRHHATRDILLRRTSGSNIETGFVAMLKIDTSAHLQKFIRGSVTGNWNETFDVPNSQAAHAYYYDIPSWTSINDLSIVYLQITESQS